MREIKFRVWDGVDYMSEPFTLQKLMRGEIEFTSECHVMQYTGLKDKNGKEIYEGDIVKYPSYLKYLKKEKNTDSIGEVRFHDGCYWLWYDGGITNVAWLFTPEIHKPSLTSKDFEIIGNIYEHPPLIKI